jgi:hypothetical protein
LPKVRNHDANSTALNEREHGREVKAKRVQQLGDSVAATRADALDIDTLSGVLLTRLDQMTRRHRRRGVRRAGGSFNRAGTSLGAAVQSTDRLLKLDRAATLRAEAARRQTDSRA